MTSPATAANELAAPHAPATDERYIEAVHEQENSSMSRYMAMDQENSSSRSGIFGLCEASNAQQQLAWFRQKRPADPQYGAAKRKRSDSIRRTNINTILP